MQAQFRPQSHVRLNTFHGPKKQLLGNHAGQAPPAWRTGPAMGSPMGAAGQLAKGKNVAQDQGSKIFISRLPVDVVEKEVEELFKKTVGPLRESFLIYNSQGKSKGMAVVVFQRQGDAAAARAKYDGKIVDGRRPIKIEIMFDGAPAGGNNIVATSTTPSLLNRISGKANEPNASVAPNGIQSLPPIRIVPSRTVPSGPKQTRQQTNVPPRTAAPVFAAHPTAPRKFRQKKGPRRIKKQLAPTSVEQLDKEMEDYRAAATDTL